MIRKLVSLIAALALCLTMLPGTARAEGETGVVFTYQTDSVTLTEGKIYVETENKQGITEAEAAPETGAYMEYTGGTLTVHGEFETTASITVSSNLTITGGEGSSLSVTAPSGCAIYMSNASVLTLDGGVDFTANSSNALVITPLDSTGPFAAADSYSGDIEINGIGNGVAVYGVPLDVKNSGSITITGVVDFVPVSPTDPMTLKSNGSITITSDDAPPIRGSAVISAGGNVSITGNSTASALFPYPITFESCGSVTVTDNGDGELLREGVTLTSDIPVLVKKGSGEKVYIGDNVWEYGGEVPPTIGSNVTSPTAYKSGDGWVFYEPAAGQEHAKLTLDNATGDIISFNQDVIGDVSIVARGRNTVRSITVHGEVKIEEGADTLNTVVRKIITDEAGKTSTSVTVYGKATVTGNWTLGEDNNNNTTSLTIREGAELTIPSDRKLYIKDFTCLTNNGTLVNNSTIALEGEAAENADAETVKGLNLSGSGKVTVEKTGSDGSNESYTNEGKQLLTPVGTLDLNNLDTCADDGKGYKWEVTKGDPDNPDKITSAKLTLKEGFNATEVILPDTAVEIVSEGECLIGALQIEDGRGANHTRLTLSGKGPLNIQQHVEITGAPENSLTVAQGAQVQVTGGVTVGAGASVGGEVTVKGTLTAAGDSMYAGVRTGKVEIGSSGTLKVSGEMGVLLAGMSVADSADEKDFAGAFTVQPGGRFEARCEPTVILASPNPLQFRENSETEVIVFPNGYLPSGCVLAFSSGKMELAIPGDGSLFNISADNVPRPVVPPSSGGGYEPTYTVTLEEAEHGSVSSDRRTASRGSRVTLTLSPDAGYEAAAVTVADRNGNAIEAVHKGGGIYTFVMPGSSVSVRAVFNKIPPEYEVCARDSSCPIWPFADADTKAWYHDGVHYCLSSGLMSGYGSGLFGPGDPLTRAQFAQILHNREGRPGVNYLMRFADVSGREWYAEAVRWAAAVGVASGYGNGRFGPGDNITREQLALMLWRYAGSPGAQGKELEFSDAGKISGYAIEAMQWAVESGIITGRDGGVLDPQGQATRAEAAAMLMRYLGE